MGEFKKIIVQFFFSGDRDENERLIKARELLTSRGGNYTEQERGLKNGVKEVTMNASVPIEQYTGHHSFDSILNKNYPDGCGAGFVGDDNSERTG